jgi:DNA-directed RNA polymerase subunit M/transcription elongation factor TFIIS
MERGDGGGWNKSKSEEKAPTKANIEGQSAVVRCSQCGRRRMRLLLELRIRSVDAPRNVFN